MAFDGQIFVCRREYQLLIRVVGQATANICFELRRFAEACFADGTRQVRVNLAECTHFDSTFLGTLLFLNRRSSECGEMGFALTAASSECQELLQRMAVAKYFPRMPDDNSLAAAQWTVLRGELNPHSISAFKRNIVDAHQELARVDEQFKAVAEACSRDLAREEK